MIEPISAVAMATTAFTTVKKFISAGQEFEQCVGQMGKWFTAVSDFRKGQSLQRRPPIFKKLFSAGSVEEEALSLLIHEKKISEQEKELMVLLNFRFGPGTWDELKEMRRKIAKQREDEVWRQAELRRNLIEGVSVTILLFMIFGFIALLVYLYMSSRGLV